MRYKTVSSQSNYQRDVRRFFAPATHFERLTSLRSQLQNKLSKDMLSDIIDTLNRDDIFTGSIASAPVSSSTSSLLTDVDDGRHGYIFVRAWETAEPSDANSIHELKTAIRSDADVESLERAMQYFSVIVDDFPGEYFLQAPFVFENILNLFETPTENVNVSLLLENCLRLTKNLSRRVKVRRLARTYYCEDPVSK